MTLPNEWTHPTLADSPADLALFAGKCRCGRNKRPSEMLEVRALGVGEPFLCTPCIEDLLRKGLTDHITLRQRAGAPQEWIDAFAVKLEAGPFRAGLPPEIFGAILTREIEFAAELAAVAEAAKEPPATPT